MIINNFGDSWGRSSGQERAGGKRVFFLPLVLVVAALLRAAIFDFSFTVRTHHHISYATRKTRWFHLPL
jgi:hypothetical protein